ncbi:hypothetical protein EAF04_000006 [Stromatinia cepivora]|nr:hypothetical protein EAF04_000006 [Stromatinia cepivora]
MFSCICQDVTLRDRFNSAGISSVIGGRSTADVPPNKRHLSRAGTFCLRAPEISSNLQDHSLDSFLQQDPPSYVSLRDIQGISDNDIYIDTIYSQNIPNNDSFISSASSSPSSPSYTASSRFTRSTTQRRSSSSQPPPTELPHLSPSRVQGNSSSSSSFGIQSTPESASPASQSSNQDCLLPLQTPVTIEALSPSNSIPISAVRPPTTPGNFSGRSTLLAGLQDRSFRYKCDHCPKEFSRHCDLKKHTNVHTRPYKCSEPSCKSAGFALPKDSRRHIRTRHEKPEKLECPYPGCQETFTRNDNRHRHLIGQHSGNRSLVNSTRENSKT